MSEPRTGIRALDESDHGAWQDLWAGYLDFYETKLEPEVHAATWSRLHDPDEPVWGALAIGGDKAVGLVHYIFHRSTWTLSRVCYLQDLYVAPAGRRRGHGAALIAHVADRAREENAARLYWLTHETNRTGQALYDRLAERSGFIQYRLPL